MQFYNTKHSLVERIIYRLWRKLSSDLYPWLRELMVGANQYIYKRELQFWSFFPVVRLCMKRKTDLSVILKWVVNNFSVYN